MWWVKMFLSNLCIMALGPKHPVKVHVWASISMRGWTRICIFEGIMDAPVYVSILQQTLLTFVKEVYPGGNRFMQVFCMKIVWFTYNFCVSFVFMKVLEILQTSFSHYIVEKVIWWCFVMPLQNSCILTIHLTKAITFFLYASFFTATSVTSTTTRFLMELAGTTVTVSSFG